MDRRVRWGLLWAASTALTFYFGSLAGRSPRPPSEPVVEATPKQRLACLANRAEVERVVEHITRAAEQKKKAPKAKPAHLSKGTGKVHDASAALMELAEQKLGAGPQAHIELLFALDETMKTVLSGGAREEDFTRELYPWIKFLVGREDDVVEMTATIMQTIAEDPDALEGIDANTLELFTEGVAYILPGAVSDDRLDEFRGYAQEILDVPEEARTPIQLAAVGQAERAMERFWATPISREDALAALEHNDVELGQVDRYVRSLEQADFDRVDFDRLLGEHVEAGKPEAVQLLGTLPLEGRAREAIDARVLRGEQAGVLNGYAVFDYLRNTGRVSWPEVQAFFEAGIANAEVAGTYVQLLLQLDPSSGPSPEYLAELAERPGLEDHDRDLIREHLAGPREDSEQRTEIFR